MGVQYPGPVSRHNLVCSLLLYLDCPDLGPFCHDGGRFATTVAIGAFGRHGATHDLARRGVGWSGRESVMAIGWFCQNAIAPPEWECEAMGSVVWVQCANLCRVFIKSIDSRILGYGHSS